MLFKERGSQLSSEMTTSAYLYSRNQIEDFLLKSNRRMRRQLKRGGTGQDGLKNGILLSSPAVDGSMVYGIVESVTSPMKGRDSMSGCHRT